MGKKPDEISRILFKKSHFPRETRAQSNNIIINTYIYSNIHGDMSIYYNAYVCGYLQITLVRNDIIVFRATRASRAFISRTGSRHCSGGDRIRYNIIYNIRYDKRYPLYRSYLKLIFHDRTYYYIIM